MTTYKEIRGTNIEVLASDPSNPVVGQVWYNSTDNVVKGFYNNPGSWATGGDLIQARKFASGCGTQTAAITMGGDAPPVIDNTELYNGTNWTEVNNLNTARYGLAVSGTQTATIVAGGGTAPASALSELWNGTNWTEVNDLNQARRSLGGSTAGTSTAALGFGGYKTPGVANNTELWNGTNWTAVNTMGSGRYRS
jgi:hypothetical protein